MRKKTASLPGISLVMPVLNGAKYIATTLNSIPWNEIENLELVIVDGGSTDETVTIVRSFIDLNPRICLHSLKGNQVDAINFGVSKARFSLLNWINCDDVFVPKALKQLLEFYIFKRPDFVYGDSFVFGNDGQIYNLLYSTDLDGPMQRDCGNLFQGSCFFSRQIFDQFGPLDNTLKVAFEYKFYDCLFANATGAYVPMFVAGFRHRKDSISQLHESKAAAEFRSFRTFTPTKIQKRFQILRRSKRQLVSGQTPRMTAGYLRLLAARALDKLNALDPPRISITSFFGVEWHG